MPALTTTAVVSVAFASVSVVIVAVAPVVLDVVDAVSLSVHVVDQLLCLCATTITDTSANSMIMAITNNTVIRQDHITPRHTIHHTDTLRPCLRAGVPHSWYLRGREEGAGRRPWVNLSDNRMATTKLEQVSE